MKYFKYIFFSLIINFSIIGDNSNVQFIHFRYFKLTESVLIQVSQKELKKSFFWKCFQIRSNGFHFFNFSLKKLQIFLNQFIKLKLLNQNKIYYKKVICKKEILILGKPKLSIENISDLYKTAGLEIDFCYVCKKLHALKNYKIKFQIFQKCINQKINPIGFFGILKLVSFG
jgi:hypothetical protein